ncbi:peptide ABC transporter substrate-binding protein [Lentilactobacillus sp. Marseille-Q4993]|uniref:peptide ABC transporter substrate-binding protein n=1 Tax=Lentilactobacillus sp. Marseille-Q4993 TaxID=3039492 RepID=UPI0024BC9699|nr:peptide ABC transporter substrate-binding protein [Lentilactobacillus sp. Marseille-Q4993]
MRKKYLTGSLLLVLGVMLAGCGASGAKKDKKTISLMQDTDLMSLDTSNHADLTQWNVLEQSMEGLYRSDQNNKPSAGIAEKVVKPTNNGLTYTFKLRKSAKWSDGKAVTAQDFENAWKRSAAPTAKSGYNYIFSGIKNADAVSAGKKPASSLGVKALDQHTLQVELDHPMPYFTKMMVLPAFFPQETSAVKKYGSKYGTSSDKMTYDGPFKVNGWNGSNDSWTLTKNHYYYDLKDIKLDQINMKVVKDANTAHNLFEQKKLDDATITGTTAQGLQNDKSLIHVEKAGTYYARLNVANGKALNNVKMRQAVNLAVDREKLTNKVLADGSTPAYTYVANKLTTDPTTGKDFGKEMEPTDKYDVSKAKELWKQGMKESGKKDVTLTVYGNDDGISKEVAEFLQSTLQQSLPNLKVEARNLPDKAVQSATDEGKFDLSQTLWLADFADPIGFMTILQTGNPQNHGKFSDKAYDKYVDNAESSAANNEKEYWSNLRNAEKVLNEKAPVVPLYHMVQSHLVNSKLKGVMYHPVGEDDYTRAYLK